VMRSSGGVGGGQRDSSGRRPCVLQRRNLVSPCPALLLHASRKGNKHAGRKSLVVIVIVIVIVIVVLPLVLVLVLVLLLVRHVGLVYSAMQCNNQQVAFSFSLLSF